MENRVLKKIIVFITVFMIVFSNCGYTLEALAATDGLSLFGLNLFGSGNIEYKAYFLDENGKKKTESISDVNKQMTMVLELTPKADGYLKSASIKAIGKDGGKANFKFDEVFVQNEESSENLTISSQADTTLLQSEMIVNASEENEVVAENNAAANVIDESTESMVTEETVLEEPVEELTSPEVSDEANTVVEDSSSSVEPEVTTETEVVTEEPTTDAETPATVMDTEEEFVDEEAALKEEVGETPFVLPSVVASASIVSDNEIKVENVIEKTLIYVNISFDEGGRLNVEDLYKAIRMEFEGTYININLDEIPISISEDVNVGWEYTKDVEVSSEYTKVSPFKIGDTEGTILEDTITVKREIADDKYLPVKETKITLKVPSLDGSAPSDLEVSALKLKATNGQDVNEVIFTKDNWEYNPNNNTLIITVQNENGEYTYGEDIYVVTLRYDAYVREKEVELETKGTVKVTEYSGKHNNEITKELSGTQKIIANVGELITYSISSKEDKINKGRINANYNSEEEKYESEFDTTVNVNILTNDVLSEFTLKDTKEFYIDKSGLEFETTDVKYKKIKFRYSEIEEFLAKNGSIEIKNEKGELLYTLNKDLIKSDNDAEISIQGDVRGVEISFKNITVNGNVSIEFTKAIGKSDYDKSAFANFKKLESRINAIVKYSEESEGTELVEIKADKEFEESKTEAEIEMNTLSLSTTEENKNVEFRIVLNNEKENSDLYVNPVFEIALPKYVKNIDMKAVNILYEAGLSVGNITVYRAEDKTERIRVEVNGIQTAFSEGEITGGTNIVINTNIELDKYAPRKEDQVKLYYINEGVTNYVSQTKWTLGVNVPTGILKTTNGFDSYVFKTNAPTGFLTINEIENYDGANSIVTSIRQGEETREIEMGQSSRVARMNLIAINNTENQCTDVAFLGRVPVKGVTDVKTGKVLETNIDAVMLSRITEDEENPLSAKIYYSQNPNADKNLNDSANGWTEDMSGLSSIKSFLIIPSRAVEPGYTFKYTYEFMIPDNLPYESKIYGSFGAFYNNHSDMAITYETTSADLVGIITKAGPKLEAKLTVDVGDGADVRENQMLKYTLTVLNSGSVDLDNVVVHNKVPANSTYMKNFEGTNGGEDYLAETNEEEITIEIGTIKAGEIKEFTYYLKSGKIDTLMLYAAFLGEAGEDEQGIYYIDEDQSGNKKKVYVDKVPDMYIENQAVLETSLLANKIESNKTKNKIIKTNFGSSLDVEKYNKDLKIGDQADYVLYLYNYSDKDLTNVEAIFKAIPGMRVISGTVNNEKANIEYNEETKESTFKIGNVSKEATIEVKFSVMIDNIPEFLKVVDCYFELKADGIKSENSDKLQQKIVKSNIQALQETSIVDNKAKEDDEITVRIDVTNNGAIAATNTALETVIEGEIEVKDMSYTGSQNASMYTELDNGKLENSLPVLNPGESISIEMKLSPKNTSGKETKKVGILNTIHNEYQEDIVFKKVNFDVENNVLTDEEEREAKKAQYEKEQEEIKKKEQAEREKETVYEPNSESSNSSNENNSSSSNTVNNNTDTNTNTNTNNNTTNENTQNQTNTDNKVTEEVKEEPKYQISGLAWKDDNNNGNRDDEEKGLSNIKVYLYDAKTNNMVKSVTTNGLGNYTFKDVPKGKYIVGFDYDIEKYKTTIYKSENVPAERNSDAIENSKNNTGLAKAVTDYITIEKDSIYNLNLGLQDRNNFDLTVAKYLTTGTVNYKNKVEKHEFDKKEIAKIELDYRKMKNSTVELEYLIVVKNEGNVAGRATVIADYLPAGTELVENKSAGWYKGTDGIVYNESLKDIVLQPEETKELKITIAKTMTEENTGVLVNKVEITRTDNTSSAVENNTNNTNTQEIIISVKTGYTASVTFFALVAITSVLFSMLVTKRKIRVDFKKFKINRIYK